ncbi:MAG TPA: hypothetical protein VGF06_06690 [Terriglobales bacterium]
MSRFFTRERFAAPQFIAGLFLLVFLVQCLWLASRAAHLPNSDPDGLARVQLGLHLWRGESTPSDGDSMDMRNAIPPDESWIPIPAAQHPEWHRSAMHYLISSAPVLVWPGQLQRETMGYWSWLTRAPYLLFGVLLGASLWYVSHRLYGNAGGYIALALYCFSPGMIAGSTLWYTQPEMGAAWGAFGAVFTSIAVAHTLYAPREVVLWNWRRIVLLGISLALAIGTQFSLMILAPMVLAFLLYLAPTRRRAALAIWMVSCLLATALLFASYFFRPSTFAAGMRHAEFFGYSIQAFTMPGGYRQLFSQFQQMCPALVIAFPATLAAFLAWPRARYFGNLAPLLAALLFTFCGLATPHFPGMGFRLVAVPFLFLFVAGVVADLLETRMRLIVLACAGGLLFAYASWSIYQLARATASSG